MLFALLNRAADEPLLADEAVADAKVSGPICYGSRERPHSPVATRAQSVEVDMTRMSVAELIARSETFRCPTCGRHPMREDWIDFLDHRLETEGY